MIIPDPPAASLRLRIDRRALGNNWRALDRLSGKADAGAAVKADAYGIGVSHAMPALIDAGAREFFVAHWSEVPPLLDYVTGSSIAVLHGVRNAEEAAFARTTNAVPVVNSIAQAALWSQTGGGRCHLMVDSGINRLGIAASQASDDAVRALDIDILMSHLACADEDSPQNARQLQVFRDVAPKIEARRLSIGNSAGIALGADYHFDVTRPGIALYGGIPHPALQDCIAQVAFPEAAILQVRDLSTGDSVGYNAMWTADRWVRAATVSIGYADGFLRARGRNGVLQWHGRDLPILGRVSMDMVVIDLLDSDAAEGDFLTVPFDIEHLAQSTGLSQYELLTVLGSRYSRD